MDINNFASIFTLMIHGFEIAAFIFAIIYWRRYRKSTERIFLFLLGYNVFTVALSSYYSRYFDGGNNIYFIFNSYMVVSFSVYFYWFSLILKRKKVAYLFLSIFLFLTLYSALFKSFSGESWQLLEVSGAIFTIICVGLFYLELLGLNTIFRTARSQKFWIASGLLIFYLGVLPIGLYQFNSTNSLQMFHVIILLTLCLFRDSFYIISFICLPKK